MKIKIFLLNKSVQLQPLRSRGCTCQLFKLAEVLKAYVLCFMPQ